MALPDSADLDLPALRLVLRVAELGSVAAAAREQGLLAATATAAVRRLERQLGVRLFTRSSRALRPTLEGSQFLERARAALGLLDQGVQELLAPMTQVRGLLRLGVSVDLGTHVLQPLLDEFLRRHPLLQLELSVSDRVADLGREPVDAAVRYGEPTQAGSVVRHLADNVAVLVAAPAYLARAGVPVAVADLARHEGIGLRLSGRPAAVWKLQDHGRPVEVRTRMRLVTDNGLMARRWALAGHGIALKSWMDVAADVQAGRLVRVLPGLQSAPYPLVLALAPGTHLTARIRALGDFLREGLQQVERGFPNDTAGLGAGLAPQPG